MNEVRIGHVRRNETLIIGHVGIVNSIGVLQVLLGLRFRVRLGVHAFELRPGALLIDHLVLEQDILLLECILWWHQQVHLLLLRLVVFLVRKFIINTCVLLILLGLTETVVVLLEWHGAGIDWPLRLRAREQLIISLALVHQMEGLLLAIKIRLLA